MFIFQKCWPHQQPSPSSCSTSVTILYYKHFLHPLTEVNVCTVVGTVHEYLFFVFPQVCFNFLVLAFVVDGVGLARAPQMKRRCNIITIHVPLLHMGCGVHWYKRFVLDVIPPTPPSLPPAISLSP